MNIFKLFRKSSGTGAPATSATGTADLWINSPIVENITGITATTKLFKGCLVAGTGIPVGSRVIDILNATTVVIDNNITASGTGVSVTFSELFPYGAMATDGDSLYYASKTNTPNRAVAATGALNEFIDGIKTFVSRVKSGAITIDDTPPIDNNDLTRKDYVENLVANSSRQYIVECRRGSVYSDFLELNGNSLSVIAKATPSLPLIVSAANGNGAPKDYIKRFTSDITFSNLKDNVTNYLLLERNVGTGVFEPKSTILAPIYEDLRSDTDREGKAYFAFDNANNGDTFYPNAYNNNAPDGAGNFYNGAVIANTPVVSGTTSLRMSGVLDSYGVYPSFIIEDASKALHALSHDNSHNQWSMGVFFQLDDPTTAPAGVQSIFSYSGLHVYVDPADRLLKANTNLNQNGSAPISMLNIVINAGSYTNPGNGNPLGLGITGPAGEILAGNKYHLALTYDGVYMRVYLNGFYAGFFGYIDGVNQPIEQARMNYVSSDYTENFSKRMVLGAYIAVTTNPSVGNFQHFVLDPYVRYTPNETVGIQSFIPTVATCTADVIKTDRNIRASTPWGGGALMFNFEGPLHGATLDDYYGNTMFIPGGNGKYIDTAQFKFGTSSLRLGGLGTAGTWCRNPYAASPYNVPFTFEMWVRPESGSVQPYQYLVRTHPQVAGTDAIGIYWIPETAGVNARTLNISVRDASDNLLVAITASTNLVTEDTWNHLAITFDGSAYRVFINGNLESTINSITTIKYHDWYFLGRSNFPTGDPSFFTGWVDDFCVIPYCKYTAAFAPPTSPNVPLDFGATPAAGSTNVPGTYQYYFDIVKYKMYKGYYGNYSQVNSIFIGEANTQFGRTRSVVPYSMGTKLRTDRYGDVVANNNNIRFYHNFGTNKLRGLLRYKARRIYTTAPGSEGELGWTNREATLAALWYFTDNDGRNSSVHRTGNDTTNPTQKFNWHSPLGGGYGREASAGLSGGNSAAIFVEFERLF